MLNYIKTIGCSPKTAQFCSDEAWMGCDDDVSAFCEYMNALVHLHQNCYLYTGVMMLLMERIFLQKASALKISWWQVFALDIFSAYCDIWIFHKLNIISPGRGVNMIYCEHFQRNQSSLQSVWFWKIYFIIIIIIIVIIITLLMIVDNLDCDAISNVFKE